MTDVKEAALHFPLKGKVSDAELMKAGKIHKTCLVTTDRGDRYILQRLNRYVFPDIDAIMENAAALRGFLAEKGEAALPMICYMDTAEGQHYYEDQEGGCWRGYPFVENSVCCESVDKEHFLESGRAFGSFINALDAFPAEKLKETIKAFHNTPARFKALHEAAEKDSEGRGTSAVAELSFAFSREVRCGELQSMLENGELPLRAVHNDTKLTNVLFDADSGKALCVIDLDTVMPGLAAYDYGDAVRYGAATVSEDAQSGKVQLGAELMAAFTEGFIGACPCLTEREKETLPLGAYTVTVELGVRFLTDYLSGDRYFKSAHPTQNLERCRVQFALAADMEKRFDEMTRIVKAAADKYK